MEGDRLGGDCTWQGCVPSKALIASTRAAVAGQDREALGLPTGEPIEIKAVLARIRALQERIHEESDHPS